MHISRTASFDLQEHDSETLTYISSFLFCSNPLNDERHQTHSFWALRGDRSGQSSQSYRKSHSHSVQVFYNTPLCYALVNIKPILPGHVLVIPYRKVQRLTDLTIAEVTDMFTTVQKVQKMLAKEYFRDPETLVAGKIEDGR